MWCGVGSFGVIALPVAIIQSVTEVRRDRMPGAWWRELERWSPN